MSTCLILVTCPNNDEAKRLSSALVAEHLAACINIVPNIQSIYRWESQIKSDQESLLIIKSDKALLSKLEQRVLELHSYSTPEFVMLDTEYVNKKYQDWLLQALNPENN